MRWSVASVSLFLLLSFHYFLFAQSPCPDGKISVKPSALDFGNVQVGDDSAVLTFQIKNNDPELGRK